MRHFYAHARKTHIIMYFFLFFESMWQDITVCFSSRSSHKQSGENTFVVVTCHYVPKALKLDLSAFTFWYKLDSKQSSKVQSCSFWWYLTSEVLIYTIALFLIDVNKLVRIAPFLFMWQNSNFVFTKRSFWYIWTFIVW